MIPHFDGPSTLQARNASRPVDADDGAVRPAARVAEAPFDNNTVNATLRSSDNVDFRVRQGILIEASSVFRDMFTLPQSPQRKRKDPGDTSNADVICVEEASNILRTFLLFCYPARNPILGSLQETISLLKVAQKYNVEFLQEILKDDFASKAMMKPLSAYALAYGAGWREGVRLAARASLSHPIETVMSSPPPEIHDITFGDVIRLQDYHKNCVKASLSVVPFWKDDKHHMEWMDSQSWVWLSVRCPNRRTNVVTRAGYTGLLRASDWWILAVEQWLLALQKCPCGTTITQPTLIHRLAELSSSCCASCSERAHSDLTRFAAEFASMVEKAVGKVALEFKN